MEKDRQYQVVINAEEQYSLWPVGTAQPLGWRDIGFKSTKELCLEHIREVWTDMRPLSLRQTMDYDRASQKGRA